MWNGRTYYWKPGQIPERYDEYRENSVGEDRREAADVPPWEAAAAVRDVLRAQIALPDCDLVREAAKALGYVRTGSKVSSAVMEGLKLAKGEGSVTVDRNGRYVLTRAL